MAVLTPEQRRIYESLKKSGGAAAYKQQVMAGTPPVPAGGGTASAAVQPERRPLAETAADTMVNGEAGDVMMTAQAKNRGGKEKAPAKEPVTKDYDYWNREMVKLSREIDKASKSRDYKKVAELNKRMDQYARKRAAQNPAPSNGNYPTAGDQNPTEDPVEETPTEDPGAGTPPPGTGTTPPPGTGTVPPGNPNYDPMNPGGGTGGQPDLKSDDPSLAQQPFEWESGPSQSYLEDVYKRATEGSTQSFDRAANRLRERTDAAGRGALDAATQKNLGRGFGVSGAQDRDEWRARAATQDAYGQGLVGLESEFEKNRLQGLQTALGAGAQMREGEETKNRTRFDDTAQRRDLEQKNNQFIDEMLTNLQNAREGRLSEFEIEKMRAALQAQLQQGQQNWQGGQNDADRALQRDLRELIEKNENWRNSQDMGAGQYPRYENPGGAVGGGSLTGGGTSGGTTGAGVSGGGNLGTYADWLRQQGWRG